MVSIERRNPLGDWSERFLRASRAAGTFSIREIAFPAQIDLRGSPADIEFAIGVASALRLFGLPNAANTWSGSAECGALWLGPDECLIVDTAGEEAQLEARLRKALDGIVCSIVDVSASRSIIEISGTDARLVLAKGCSLDLHASAFRVPQVAQSLLAKAQVILQIVEDRPTFRLFVRNSFAPYLAEWLLDAVAECAAARDAGLTSAAPRMET